MRKPKKVAVFWNKYSRTLNDQSVKWLWVLTTAVQKTLKPESGVMASAIAYFALFSLFPLILLSISIASFGFDPAVNQHDIIKKLEFIAPALDQLLGANIDQIVHARGSVGSFAVLGLIWSASSVFYSLTHTLSEIWDIKEARSSWKWRGLSLLFVLAFIGPTLFFVSFAGSVIANIYYWLPDQILILSKGINGIFTILLDISFFFVLYILLPRQKTKWRELLPGAVGAGLLWELAKKIFLSFIFTYISLSNLVYGTVAAIVAFLAWAYFTSLIFLFGAYLNVSYWQLRNHDMKFSIPK